MYFFGMCLHHQQETENRKNVDRQIERLSRKFVKRLCCFSYGIQNVFSPFLDARGRPIQSKRKDVLLTKASFKKGVRPFVLTSNRAFCSKSIIESGPTMNLSF